MSATKAKKIRFNIIDIILMVILVGAVGVLVYILAVGGRDSSAASEPIEIIYEVELKNVREEFRGAIKVGDTVVDTVKRYTIGEVIDVRYEEALYTGVDKATGQLVNSPYPGRTNIIMTVQATADTTPGYYSIDGYRLMVGTGVYFRTPGYTGSGYCITVQEGNK